MTMISRARLWKKWQKGLFVFVACVRLRFINIKPCRCFGMLNSSAMGHLGQVWAAVNAAGLRLTNLRTVRLSSSDASDIFDVCPAGVVDTLSAAFEIVGPSATAAWNDVVEGLSSSLPSSAASGLIGAASETESERCLGAFFGGGYQGRASRPPQFGHTAAAGFAGSAGGGSSPHSSRAVTACMDPYVTTVVVLPHIVKRGAAGHVLQHLQAALASEQKEPLAITAMQMFDLELITAEEFLEVYQHVAPEYGEMTAELSSGLCLAIEVRGADAVARIRHICGPRDVDIAKQIRPESIRAKHGASTVQNAVHCTDLDEDGATESEYFFNVLQK